MKYIFESGYKIMCKLPTVRERAMTFAYARATMKNEFSKVKDTFEIIGRVLRIIPQRVRAIMTDLAMHSHWTFCRRRVSMIFAAVK